ncbi:MAG: protein kinase [Cyanobacteria bacterium SZAS-4]|nr:protein kinase [Cyanobacteria bacterium SZAS-4]
MSSSSQETTRVCLACGLETQDEILNCPNDGSLLAAGADPLLGTTFLDKYQITKVLGRGGMSAVYKAKHLMMDRYVAIKFLRSELVHDNVMLQRFQLESKAVSLLKHPNIITVHDFGLSPQGVPYLIMDFLEGKTVSDVVAEIEYMEPSRCVALFTQICNALAHTHNKGVIHRDIKPSNLIISIGDDGQEIAQVVDFGIAKLLEREASDASKLTASGEVFGSPAYMSPEQCNGSAIDSRTDMYALACVIYNCLTGRPPLLGRNAMETVLMHVRDMPKSFGEIRPDLTISPVLERVVFKGLAKDPDERFASMTEFGSELAKSLLESNNNTTWVIPAQAQRTMQNNDLGAQYEHTMPVGLAPNVTPHPNSAEQSAQTQNIQADAIQPSADMGKADPVVSLKDDFGSAKNSSATGTVPGAGGRMNPNAMIMPGSDLFGYESIAPALPDQAVKPVQDQTPAPARPSTPAPTKIVDDIPLAAPPKLVGPTQSGSFQNPTQQSGSFQNPTQSGSFQSNPNQSSSFQQSKSLQPVDADEKNKNLIILVLSGILALLVVIGLIAWFMKSQG